LGVARIILLPDGEQAEFSVLVGDKWQGKGIGAELLKCCLVGAKHLGVQRVWGLVLAENTQMLKLGRKLGFDVKRVPYESEYEMCMDLDNFLPGFRPPKHHSPLETIGLENVSSPPNIARDFSIKSRMDT
ncbi:GNAT family N-acetyltransferase, partial [Thermodesulfobacteriota bacterium]